MTPDEHAARAEQLADDAETLFVSYSDEIADGRQELDAAGWRLLDVQIRLAELHHRLAQTVTVRPPGTRRGSGPVGRPDVALGYVPANSTIGPEEFTPRPDAGS